MDKTEELTQMKLQAEIEALNARAEYSKTEKEKTLREINIMDKTIGNLSATYSESRNYTFYDPVKEITIYKAIEEIALWARRDPREPINITFVSQGGSVLDGLAFYDFLKLLRDNGTPVNTCALGYSASMAAVLLQSGGERTMGKNSWLLIHEVSDVVGGNMSMIEDQVEFAKRLQGNLLDILAERSTLSRTQIQRRWKKKDWWLSAEECLEHGFIDRIV